MGNLHEGHLDLTRIAKERGDCVVTSIFVNPLQFGANEDFSKYPRTLEKDCEKLEGLSDLVFAPTEADLYPVPQQVTVEPPLENDLCGAFRPGHFRGVATVVLKLFNIVQPHAAVFGKKDFQQFFIISRMVEQLNLPIEIIGAETIRADDGLALSSRNQYMNAQERAEAPFMFQTLNRIREAISGGNRDFPALAAGAAKDLEKRGWRVDYVAVRSQKTLLPPEDSEKSLVLLAAARLGKTRLIDNLEVGL
jgi:pantoate--beta-alanine ligase